MAKNTGTARVYGLLGDVPVGDHHLSRDAANKDGLDRAAFAKVLAHAAVDTADTLTIGIYGDWGEGKTSLMYLMKKEVGETNGAIGVWFNAWQYERDEHLIIPLIASIARDIDEAIKYYEANMQGSQAKAAANMIKGAVALKNALRAVAYGFSFKAKAGIPLLAGAEAGFSGKEMIQRYQELANDASLEKSLYFEAFEKLRALSRTAKDIAVPKIVVFVDDLDRCLPDAAVRLLENIKLVLSIPNFSFVMGMAKTVIQKFVAHKFKKELDLDESYFNDYLDKFIQVPVHLPAREDNGFEAYIEGLLATQGVFSEPERTAFEGLPPLIAAVSKHNPRSAVRFINQILVLSRITVEQGSPVETRDLVFASALREYRVELLDGRIDFSWRSETAADADSPTRSAVLELRNMQWPDGLEQRMPFHEALAVLIEFDTPGNEAATLKDRLIRLSEVQRDPQVRQALARLAESMHLCKALQGDSGLGWLRDRTRIAASFQLAAVVRSEPDPEPVASIEVRVREQGEDPLTIPEILEQIRRLHFVPYFAQPYVKDLAPLRTLTELTTLDLSDSTGITDLTPLRDLPQLTTLSLAGCTRITDLTPLRDLPQLTTLSLTDCTRITDLSPLRGLPQLTTLALDNCTGITDLSPLRDLTQLTSLRLSGCTRVTDLSPLASLPHLASCSLPGGNVLKGAALKKFLAKRA